MSTRILCPTASSCWVLGIQTYVSTLDVCYTYTWGWFFQELLLKISFTNQTSTKPVTSFTMCFEIVYNIIPILFIYCGLNLYQITTLLRKTLLSILLLQNCSIVSHLQAQLIERFWVFCVPYYFCLTLSCAWHRTMYMYERCAN